MPDVIVAIPIFQPWIIDVLWTKRIARRDGGKVVEGVGVGVARKER